MPTAWDFILWVLRHCQHSCDIAIKNIFLNTADGFGEIACFKYSWNAFKRVAVALADHSYFVHLHAVEMEKILVDKVNVFEANNLILRIRFVIVLPFRCHTSLLQLPIGRELHFSLDVMNQLIYLVRNIEIDLHFLIVFYFNQWDST